MNRFTIKELHIVNDMNKAMDKLSKLEDLEQELGIDLLTIMNALKNGIYKKGSGPLFKDKIMYSNCPMLSLFHRTIDNCLLEDYGKTWALTREELE